MVEHALAYAGAGFHVLPCHWPTNGGECSCSTVGCKAAGKHPATKHGVNDATVDPEEIRRIWGRRPLANIGIATGEKSFDVVDVDADKGGYQSLEQLIRNNGPMPITARSRTGGGGEHICFRHLVGIRNNNTGKLGEGLDIRTDGGYIVAPPSLHRSGRRYEWIDGGEIVDAPEWLETILRQEFASKSQVKDKISEEQWRAISIAGGMTAGDRHNAVASVAGLLLNDRKIEPHLAEILVHGYNLMCCEPPKSRAEVQKIINYIWRRTLGER